MGLIEPSSSLFLYFSSNSFINKTIAFYLSNESSNIVVEGYGEGVFVSVCIFVFVDISLMVPNVGQ
jgi:hypothetical protein